jgi:hypothetical protein
MYDKFQATWHCHTDSFKGLNADYIIYSYGTKRNFSSMIQRNPDSLHCHPNPRSILAKLIDEYSARDLTKFEDRLPAMSGIAKELSSLWNEEFVAGFWRSFLVNQLLLYKAMRSLLPLRAISAIWSPEKDRLAKLVLENSTLPCPHY